MSTRPSDRTRTTTASTGGPRAHVGFVGAGPGDPGLLTLRAAALLGSADVVVTDLPDPDPVVDARGLDVSFRSMASLIADLRAQGLGNVLRQPGPPLTRGQWRAAQAHFADAGRDGRTVEHFEILTLSGWKK